MIGRPPRRLRINSAKPNLGQIEFLDKGVDRSNRIVFANPVVQAFRKQRSLPAIRAFDKAPHMIPPKIAQESYRANHPIHNEIEGFHTAWTRCGLSPDSDASIARPGAPPPGCHGPLGRGAWNAG